MNINCSPVWRSLVMAAAGIVFAAGASADSFSSVVVYGDSLSDNGNLFALTGQPGAPYYMGRRSNGPVAVEQVAAALKVPLLDFAVSGATTGIGNFGDGGTPTSVGAFGLPGMLTEFATSQNVIAPNVNGLFIVWGGPDDLLSPSPADLGNPQAIITRAIGNILTIVGTLLQDGVTHILVPGMPDLGLTPEFAGQGPIVAAQASAFSTAFNTALQASLPKGVVYYNTAGLLDAIVADPAGYGFTDVTDACYNGVTVCANPSQYLFYDSFHPTTQADTIAADAFLEAVGVPEPGMLSLLALGCAVIAGFKYVRPRR